MEIRSNALKIRRKIKFRSEITKLCKKAEQFQRVLPLSHARGNQNLKYILHSFLYFQKFRTFHCFSVKLHNIGDHIQFSLKTERSNIHISNSATMVKSYSTLEEMAQEILAAGDKLTVIHSFDDSCPPCKTMSQKFERLAFEEEDVVFLKLNAGKCCHSRACPSFIFFKEGLNVYEVDLYIKDGSSRWINGEVWAAKVEKLKRGINKHK